MAAPVVFTQEGRRIELGGKGRSGGEGTVFLLGEGAVKLYHAHRLAPELHEKLRAMVENPPEDPTWATKRHHSIAWPSAVVYGDAARTRFAGLQMPLLNTKVFQEMHRYTDPSDRLRRFGGRFDWRYLVGVARNLASAVGAIHQKGHRVGDLRETNVLVAPNAMLTLIDCDSFQVRDGAGSRVHHCRVGTGEYLPLELQGADFGRNPVDRYHSDLFAIGVLVFKCLMQGYHPYQARGPLVEDAPSTEAKIRKGHFPYVGSKGVEPPAGAPPWAILPPVVQAPLKRCFVDGHRNPEARPTAVEWLTSIEELWRSLGPCRASRAHWYWEALASCPWCAVAREGHDPFPDAGLGDQVALEDAREVATDPNRAREYFRRFVAMAAADGEVSEQERDYLVQIGAQLRFGAAESEDELRRVGGGRPRLEVDPARVELRDVPVGGTVSASIAIRNGGKRRLHGSVSAQARAPWLSAAPGAVDLAPGDEMEVDVAVDASGLTPGSTVQASLEISTNGGTRVVPVQVQVARFVVSPAGLSFARIGRRRGRRWLGLLVLLVPLLALLGAGLLTLRDCAVADDRCARSLQRAQAIRWQRGGRVTRNDGLAGFDVGQGCRLEARPHHAHPQAATCCIHTNVSIRCGDVTVYDHSAGPCEFAEDGGGSLRCDDTETSGGRPGGDPALSFTTAVGTTVTIRHDATKDRPAFRVAIEVEANPPVAPASPRPKRRSGSKRAEDPRPEPRPARLATLTLDSSPQGVEVHVDGAFACLTPCKLEVGHGRHVVEFIRGKRRVRREVRVLQDATVFANL